MVSSKHVDILEAKAQGYWKLSRQWRGDRRYGIITMNAFLLQLADLAGSLNSLGWRRAEHLTAQLLDQAINNKRCRKRKPIDNVVMLFHSYNNQLPRVSKPEELVGKRVRFVIIDELDQIQVG